MARSRAVRSASITGRIVPISALSPSNFDTNLLRSQVDGFGVPDRCVVQDALGLAIRRCAP